MGTNSTRTSTLTPLLMRRAEKIKTVRGLEVFGNMTVVTTPSNQTEMHDQMQDATAPRND